MLEFFKKIFGSFRVHYIPLLMVYFAYGASGFTSIAETFWVKEHLNLSPAALASLGFWLMIPWTVKIVFGQFADSVRIFGSGRKIYIFIGACFMAVGSLTLVGLADGNEWLRKFGSAEALYFTASLFSVIGFVLQDVIADAMSTEVVDRFDAESGNHFSQKQIEEELAQIQWLGRISIMIAGVVVSGIGGWLAQIFSYSMMFKFGLLIPLISVLGAAFVKLHSVPRVPVNWWVLGGGLLFGSFAIYMNHSGWQYPEEIVFVASSAILCFLMMRLGIGKELFFAAIVIFVFRAVPGAGPGVGWWMIDVLNFDKAFQGTLSQIGSILGLLGLFVFRKYIIEKPIGFTLAWLTVAGAVVSLPTIGLFYGIHEILGISARTVALVDTTISAPLGQLSMVPLLTLVARSCPSGNAATWFALMASFMNLSISANQLGTKYLNQVFLVSRGYYDNIGILLIITWIIGLVVPLVVIFIFSGSLNNRKKAN